MRATPEAEGRFAVAVTAVAAAIVLLVTAASVHLLPQHVRFHVGQVFPEGWKLFVADASVPRYRALVPGEGGWRDPGVLPLAQPANAFGLDRGPRWQSVELARLAGVAPDLRRWTSCRRGVQGCLDRASERAMTVRSRTAYETLCGTVGLVRWLIREPAQAREAGSHRRTTHALVLRVQC